MRPARAARQQATTQFKKLSYFILQASRILAFRLLAKIRIECSFISI